MNSQHIIHKTFRFSLLVVFVPFVPAEGRIPTIQYLPYIECHKLLLSLSDQWIRIWCMIRRESQVALQKFHYLSFIFRRICVILSFPANIPTSTAKDCQGGDKGRFIKIVNCRTSTSYYTISLYITL